MTIIAFIWEDVSCFAVKKYTFNEWDKVFNANIE